MSLPSAASTVQRPPSGTPSTQGAGGSSHNPYMASPPPLEELIPPHAQPSEAAMLSRFNKQRVIRTVQCVQSLFPPPTATPAQTEDPTPSAEGEAFAPPSYAQAPDSQWVTPLEEYPEEPVAGVGAAPAEGYGEVYGADSPHAIPAQFPSQVGWAGDFVQLHFPPQEFQGPSYAAEMPENCPILRPVVPSEALPRRARRGPVVVPRYVPKCSDAVIQAICDQADGRLAKGEVSVNELLYLQRSLLPRLRGRNRPRELTRRGDLVHLLQFKGYRIEQVVSFGLSEVILQLPEGFRSEDLDQDFQEVFWVVQSVLQETPRVTAEHILGRFPLIFDKLGLRRPVQVAQLLQYAFPGTFAVEYLVQRGQQ